MNTFNIARRNNLEPSNPHALARSRGRGRGEEREEEEEKRESGGREGGGRRGREGERQRERRDGGCESVMEGRERPKKGRREGVRGEKFTLRYVTARNQQKNKGGKGA